MKITITGEPRTKKNSQRVVRYGNRYAIRASKAYEAYEADFIKQIQVLGLQDTKDCRCVNVSCVFYMSTKRRVDLTNLLSGALDCLVASGVLEDDNCKIAYSHDGSRVKYDKTNPRVEITIEETTEINEFK